MAESGGTELGGRRRGVGVVPARLSALEQLKNLKQNGGRRIDKFELKLEDKIYDEVSDAEFKLLKARRRREAEEFVVEDEGIGYLDGGEEYDDWDTRKCARSDDADGLPSKISRDSRRRESSSKKLAGLAAAASLMGKRRGLSSMFAAASGSFGKKPGDDRGVSSRIKFSTENVLDDVLAEITVEEGDREREKRRRRGLRSVEYPVASLVGGHLPCVQQTPFPDSGSLAPGWTSSRSAHPQSTEKVNEQVEIVDISNHEMSLTFVKEDVLPVDSEESHVVATECTLPAGSFQVEIEAKKIKVEVVETVPLVDEATGQAQLNTEQSDVKVGLNAKISLPVSKVEEAGAAWHSLCMASEPENVANKCKNEVLNEGPESSCNDLPLDSEGNLSFYLLDAHEEVGGNNGGTIFLFGKVLTNGKYVSCCVVVRNVQRCVFAVPTSSVFPQNDLVEFELAAKSGGASEKAALNAKLQDLAIPLKKELGEHLMDLDVVKFSMVPVKRSYAFERSDVPRGQHYFLKLTYSFKDPPLPMGLRGIHFAGVLGTHTSALELLLIKKKIKGPCWLSIASPVRCASSSEVSWCKIEVNVESPKDFAVTRPDKNNLEIPQLVVAAINLKTVINHKDNVNEIACASVVYCSKVKVDAPMPLAEWNNHKMLNHFSIVRKLDGGIFPTGFTSEVLQLNSKAGGTNVLSHESSERALLNHLMLKLYQLDPDVLVGHNISGFDLDVLLHRLQACKVQSKMWSKIGRLKRSQMPKLSGGGNIFGAGAGLGHMVCIAGRLLCDTYLSSRELLKQVSYSLTELSRNQLGRERKELVPSEIPIMYQSSASLLELIVAGETDAWLALGLMFHLSVLPLTRQLTNISGNLWSKTLQGARAQQVEFLLLHEFHSRKFIVPDKLSQREKERITNKRKSAMMLEDNNEGDDAEGGAKYIGAASGTNGKRKKGPAYLGGLVLEPKKGLYDKYILLLDFNSLYPSIIQEYNVCFTTVDSPLDGTIPSLPSSDTPGVLPQILKGLVERRKLVKVWLKRATDMLKCQQFDIQQQALKLTANSMYGCLGFTNSRFYAKPLAELITSQGREILQNTVDLVQNNLNLEVIYGDTDSIMIHTGLDDIHAARTIGAKAIKEVNKKYKLLEIDMDGIFKRMLLLKKKKYAAVKIEVTSDGTVCESMEQKGLDIVRRDWSLLSKEIGNFTLNQILSEGSREDVVEAIHSQLRKLQEDMRNGQIDLDKYIITKTLSKPPEDYPDAKNQPHVQVALRRRQSGHHVGCFAGDTVPYIICIEKSSAETSVSSIADRARHPDELKNDNGNWLVDIDYYISQQIHPVVSRLCAPIEGTDARHIAECLGLDPTKFHRSTVQDTQDHEEVLLSSATILDDDDRYRHCEPLQLTCPKCRKQYIFPGVANIIAELSSTNSIPNVASISLKDETVASMDADLLLEDPLQCRRCSDDGSAQRLSPAMLANQVKLRAEEFITRYYNGWMACDDESCGHSTRNINLRTLEDAERGTVCPNYPRCNGRLNKQYTEVELYKQLTHFYRLLDASRVLDKLSEVSARMAAEKKLATVRTAFDSAAQAVKELRDRCAYKWVQLNTLCISVN